MIEDVVIRFFVTMVYIDKWVVSLKTAGIRLGLGRESEMEEGKTGEIWEIKRTEARALDVHYIGKSRVWEWTKGLGCSCCCLTPSHQPNPRPLPSPPIQSSIVHVWEESMLPVAAGGRWYSLFLNLQQCV